KGNVIVANHISRPGIVGHVCILLDKCNISISNMQIGKVNASSESMMILAVEDVVPSNVMQEIVGSNGIISAKLVQL
ncbi:MAG: phosphoglycerate dehydrogenase, partial [Methanocalculaceae archaeon]|nr:phosphoglycerate dehydrogenase [Methanocalculaceae archaeon]